MLQLMEEYTVLVVGGTGGIGSAIVRAFASAGARVTATGATEQELERTKLIASDRLQLRTLDITDDSHIRSFVDGIKRLDALINCAGILDRDREYELETFKHVLDVNLVGAFRMCLACYPVLRKTKGAIVNIASMNAFQALPRIPAYCASKGGIVMLTKSLAQSWGTEGIRVNAVAPGYIETSINEKGRQDRKFYDAIKNRTALGRWGQPDDIGYTVAFLCSPAARYITGSVVSVDGGFLSG